MRPNSYISTYCNKMFRFIVLLLFTWSVGEVYAGPGDEETTLTGEVIITGDYVVNTNHTIKGTGTSVTITGNLTVNKELKIKDNSLLIVKGNLILNNDAKVKINEGGEAGEGAIVIVQHDLEINGVANPTEVFAKNKAIMIVEGNLVLSGDNPENKIKVEEGASITIKKQISGTGKIEFPGPEEGKKGYFTVLGGLATGTSMDNIKIDIPGLKDLPESAAGNLIYIDGVGDLSFTYKEPGGPGNPEVETTMTIDASNTSSTAYTSSVANMAAAAAAGLLPIELTSFTASATNNGFVFNWVTASEVNNDYFTLEYSINGVDFIKIDYVHGAGTTSETSEYEYRWDDAPNFEMIYFRLKQTDYNGEYDYSDVIVSCRKKSAGATRTFRYGPLNLQVVDGELRYIENK